MKYFAATAVLLLAACSSSSDSSDQTADSGVIESGSADTDSVTDTGSTAPDQDSGSRPVTDAGGEEDTGTPPDTGGPDVDDGVPPVSLMPPENGFQIQSTGRMIMPGEDVEFCEVVQLPGGPDDTYHVGRFEVEMHPWSHHVIVTAARPGSIAEGNMAPGMVKPCVRAGDAYGEGLVDVFGAQQPYRELTFPEGVGRVFHGGQMLVFDYHYFNPTTEPIPARHALNFHTLDESEVQFQAQDFGFYNYQIFTAPQATSKYAATCKFNRDVMVWMLVRHTHKWGTDFHVWRDGGEADGEHLWTSEDWELDVDHELPGGPILVKKGEGFRFQCEFNNTTDKLLTFGVKATDEMCILFGVYWNLDGEPGAEQICTAKATGAVDMP